MNIPTIDHRVLADICKANDIAFLGVFGSYARGEETPESDLDLLVRFGKGKSLLELVRIERELSERIGRKVDLVTEPSLIPYLRDCILQEVQPLYVQA